MKLKEKLIIVNKSILMIVALVLVIISLFVDPIYWIGTIILLIIYVILLNTLDGW